MMINVAIKHTDRIADDFYHHSYLFLFTTLHHFTTIIIPLQRLSVLRRILSIFADL